MPSLVAREKELYEDVYVAVPSYRDFSPGEIYAPMFAQMIRERGWHLDTGIWQPEVIDAGCGTGKGTVALTKEGLFVSQIFDLTDFGLIEEVDRALFTEAVIWRPLTPQLGYLRGGAVDFVYCCDVLEHIPREYTMLAIARVLEITRRAAFFTVSLAHDRMGAWLGQTLHKTVEGFTWWRDNLGEVGTLIEARDLLNTGIYLVGPRT